MTPSDITSLATKIRENPKAFSAPPNSHLIEIIYATPTDRRGPRLILVSHRYPGDRITDNYDDTKRSSREQGLELVQMLGYTPVTVGETKDGFFACVKEFLPLKEALAAWVARKGAKVA